MADGPSDVTTRRGYIAGLAGTSLTLAGLWEVLDVGGSHGHGHGDNPLPPAKFRYRHENFLEKYRGDDGVVEPPLPSEVPREMRVVTHHGSNEDTSPIYLSARKFAFSPGELRLYTDVSYTFYMMAMDVTHGASINTPTGSVMHRLPPETLVQDTLTFSEPGEYLLYCGFYCGVGHDGMSAKIRVIDEKP